MRETPRPATVSAARRRKGFTLVELLVVIGIIAILISVLLPVLGSARRSAATVKCLSNLRNLHNAFLMYAGDFKNAMPCGRQDDEDPILKTPINQNNRYWIDMLYPYVMRKSAPFPAFVNANDADAYMKSIFWCPTWLGEHPELNAWVTYTDRFKNGYGYNIHLGFKPDYPNPDANLPSGKHAMRAAGFYAPNFGRYYRRNELSQSSDRMIVADANLWTIGFNKTNAAGDIAGQYVLNQVAGEDSGSPPGAMNLDRYRHGKYPTVTGNRYNIKGGSTNYNVLFVDGHAQTLQSATDGYKAIRLRYP